MVFPKRRVRVTHGWYLLQRDSFIILFNEIILSPIFPYRLKMLQWRRL